RASPCQGEGREVESRRPLHTSFHVPLAQLDRAFDYESKGREFESLKARHSLYCRDVAQLGRAPGLGPGGRMFKSCRPDHLICGCSSMVELQPSKLVAWVRFPSPAS